MYSHRGFDNNEVNFIYTQKLLRNTSITMSLSSRSQIYFFITLGILICRKFVQRTDFERLIIVQFDFLYTFQSSEHI